MKVSIVIVNYNTFELTRNCIQSIIDNAKGTEYEIVLVDNSSSECNPDDFLKIFPHIKLVKSSYNGGFAYGNNLGIAHATGQYILLLNSDTLFTENSLEKSLAFAENKKNCGVVGCRMVYPNGQLQYTARRFRSILWEILDLFRIIPYLLPYSVRKTLMLGKYFKHDEDIECDWLNGAFFLFPRKIIFEFPAQKLDERFFMYGEDQLWCLQIKKLGYKNYFFAGTTIIHYGSASTDINKHLLLRKIMMKNELEIMKYRKGKGLYFYIFSALFLSKEIFRIFIKKIIFRFTSRKLH